MFKEITNVIAKTSSARRLKVGAIAVKDGRILSMGYNGTPAGMDNNCEDVVADTYYNDGSTTLKTRPEVIHAEMNLILKMARDGEAAKGADMFITHSPCFECAKAIMSAGFLNIFYETDYRNDDGIKMLGNNGVNVVKI